MIRLAKSALALTLALLVALLGVCLVRYAPPSPVGRDAPPTVFSAARARGAQAMLTESGPRTVGSHAGETARAWLEAELAKSGFHTEVQKAWACSVHGACGLVENVIATRTGAAPAAAPVLLMAHYDSVACSPGASDDGVGIAAVIGIARALAASAPLRRTVVIALTDGEESGLLGATAFVEQHPLGAAVRGAVNVDARGGGGPSAMFETSTGNAWLLSIFARRAERPVTSSLFYEAYRRMPNDTDFTTVRSRVTGVNFANIRDISSYHTPLDDLAHADPGTLQHHGDQALAMIRALADAGPELEARHDASHDAVWFDVLALKVVRWPAAASSGLALAAFALVLGWTIRLRAWGGALAASLAALVAALAVSFAAGALLRFGGALPVPWVAHPLPALLLLHGTCIAAGLATSRAVLRRLRSDDAGRGTTAEIAWAGTWLTWGVLGVVTATVAPGACFLFVVPTFAAGFVGWLRVDLAAAVPALVAGVLWLPVAILVYDGLGLVVPVLASLSSVMLVTTLTPLVAIPRAAAARTLELDADHASDAPAPSWVWRVAALAVLVVLVTALLVPSFSREHPQRVNVVLRQDDAPGSPARVFVEASWATLPWGAPPAAMVRALGPASTVGRAAPLPWSAVNPFAPAPRMELAPPRVELRPELATTHLHLSSPRHAKTLALAFSTDRVARVRVENQVALPRAGVLVLRGVPDEGVEVDLATTGSGPLLITVLEITPGLPPASAATIANAVRDARDERAVMTQEGDVTVVTSSVDVSR